MPDLTAQVALRTLADIDELDAILHHVTSNAAILQAVGLLMISYFSTFDPAVFDAIGVAGFGLYVLNYTLLTFRKIQTEYILYFVINGTAASMVLIGLASAFNLASAMIQIFWVGISIVAIIVRLRRRPLTQSDAALQY